VRKIPPTQSREPRVNYHHPQTITTGKEPPSSLHHPHPQHKSSPAFPYLPCVNDTSPPVNYHHPQLSTIQVPQFTITTHNLPSSSIHHRGKIGMEMELGYIVGGDAAQRMREFGRYVTLGSRSARLFTPVFSVYCALRVYQMLHKIGSILPNLQDWILARLAENLAGLQSRNYSCAGQPNAPLLLHWNAALEVCTSSCLTYLMHICRSMTTPQFTSLCTRGRTVLVLRY
jgi:hypothetical protein